MEKIDKRKIKYIAGFGGIVILLVIAMGYFIFGLGKSPSGQSSGQPASVHQSVPSGESQKIMESKSEAYQTGGVQRKRSALDGYFETLAPEGEDISLVSDDESSAGSSGASGSAGAQGSGAFASGQTSGGDAVARQLGGPPVDDATSTGGGSGYRNSGGHYGGNRSGSGNRSGGYNGNGGNSAARSISSMTPEEKLEYDRRRAEMVRDVLTEQNGAGSAANASTAGSDADGRTAAGHAAEAEPLDFSFSSSDGIISSLDDEQNDIAVRYADDVKRPFRCMFIRDEKIKNGQRVAVRLLEEYKQDGIRIPANTHLQAICKIDDRLRLTIRSLEMNGKIIPLQLEAYDSDGLAGIYCPEASKSVKTATNDLITTAGSSLGGLVGNLANTVIRTGATIARTASGENTVTINSGYEFYLVKIEKR